MLWVKNTTPNELWFTNDNSEDFMLVSDVVSDASPQLGGDLASNGFDILMADGDKVIFGDGGDMQMYNVTGTGTSKIDNLLANAILEFNFTGGLISFDGLNDRLDIRDGWALRIRDATDVDWGEFSHDGTDFNLALTNTTDWNITGANVFISGDKKLRIEGATAGIFTDFDRLTSSLDFIPSGAGNSIRFRTGGKLEIWDNANVDHGDFFHDGTNFYVQGHAVYLNQISPVVPPDAADVLNVISPF